jgi:hypothetical protein
MHCDYVKFIVVAEPDLFTTSYLEEWYETFGAEEENGRKRWRLTCLGQAGIDKRKYALEIWGDPAQQVCNLSWAKWHKWLQRYDFAETFSLGDVDAIDALYELSRQAGMRHNVNRYSSRKRTKKTGRSGGGEGVAFGSHRSDFRLSIYKRHDEPLKWEVQMAGGRLGRLVQKTIRYLEIMGVDTIEPWSSLETSIWYEGDTFMQGHLIPRRQFMDLLGYRQPDNCE